jgi:hypothetical protein
MSSEDSTAARRAPEASQSIPLEEAVHSSDAEALTSAAADPTLTEDLALSLLKHADLPAEALEALSKNSNIIQRRKVRSALVGHPRTPRHISLPMLRHLYTFDLMQLALTPVVPADVKRAADEVLVTRLETISSGEKLSLARRASGRIAAELLADKEARVMQTALENSRLTESAIVRAVLRHDASAALVQAVCQHAKWSLRREVRIALLRNEKTPLARALEFARNLPPALLREVLQNSRLPASTKTGLLKDLGPCGDGRPRPSRLGE